jgi:DNA-binding MarR family transcriptional regulator
MDAIHLFLLGRKLTKIGEQALTGTGGSRLGAGGRLILEDVVTHPDSSIRDITDRTGFPQSHVSSTVAHLRDLGVLATAADPTDRRRTLVRTTEFYEQRAAERGSAPADSAIAAALSGLDPDVVAEVTAALDVLGRILISGAASKNVTVT